MLDLIVEGFSSLRFGCTFALGVLGVAPVLVGRRWSALTAFGFWLAAGLSGWARFADLWFAPPGSWLLALLGVGLGISILGAVVRPGWPSAVGAAVYAGLVGGWLWVPCVGTHLSGPLNDAAQDRSGTVGSILAYVLGVSLPLVVLAALPALSDRALRWRETSALRWGAAAFGAIIGLVIAVGWYSEFVVRFTG